MPVPGTTLVVALVMAMLSHGEFAPTQGTITADEPEPGISYNDLLDIQLNLYDVMLDDILKNRLYVS